MINERIGDTTVYHLMTAQEYYERRTTSMIMYDYTKRLEQFLHDNPEIGVGFSGVCRARNYKPFADIDKEGAA